MARKKHKAGKRPLARAPGLSGGQRRERRGGGGGGAALDLFRAAAEGGSGGGGDRRWFWGLLAAGFALRLVAALGGNYGIRPDEYWQYLEQAHRLVFGYGLVTWEFSVGARNWLTVLPAALFLAAANALGLDRPDQYADAVEIGHAALSMSLPAGMFFFARNYYGRRAGFAALALGCLWHEIVIFAPHALTEFYGTYFIFGALALMSLSPSRARIVTVGALLGFAFTMRVHYGLIVAAAAAAWVYALSRRSAEDARRAALLGVLGGGIPLLLFLVADWAAWGFPHVSALMYFQAMTDGGVPRLLDNHARYTHLVNLAIAGGGAGLLALALGLGRWRRHGLVLALAVPTFAFNAAQLTQPYSSIFAVVCFLLLILADWTARALASPKLRPAGMAAACAALLIAVLGFSGKIPERYHLGNERWVKKPFPLFGEDPKIAAAHFMGRLPREEVGALIVDVDGGGIYYTVHHRVPIYSAHHPASDYMRGHDWRTAATHILTLRNLEAPDLEKIYDQRGVKIYRTGAKSPSPLPGFTLDLSTPTIIQSLLQAGVIDSPPEKARF